MSTTSKIKSVKVLEDKVSEYLELQDKIEELTRIAETIKDQIKDYMGDEQVINTPKYTIKNTEVTSSRFSSSEFQKANPKLYEQYKVSSTYRRFSITK